MGRKKIGKFLKNLVVKGAKKALKSKKIRSVLKKSIHQIKGTMDAALDVACPSCKKVAKVAIDLPFVKKAIKSGRGALKKKCPACDDVLDIIVES